jgi:hypothetical protein
LANILRFYVFNYMWLAYDENENEPMKKGWEYCARALRRTSTVWPSRVPLGHHQPPLALLHMFFCTPFP